MKRFATDLVALVAAVDLLPAPAAAQAEPPPAPTRTTVTAAAAGEFPSDTTFNGLAVQGLRFGMLVTISSTGSATGQFQTTLLGPGEQSIEVEGEAASGSAAVAGTASFSGSCTVDMGDGTPPLENVPFTVTVNSDGAGKGSLGLVLGAASLPAATINEGSMTIE